MNSIVEIWDILAQKYNSKIAFKDDLSGNSLTFKEVNSNINKVVKLLKFFKVGKNDKVTIFLNPHILWHVVNQAVMKNNSISVPCDPVSSFEQIIYILKYMQSKFLFTNKIKFIDYLMQNETNLESLNIFYIGNQDISKYNHPDIKIYNLAEELKTIDDEPLSYKIGNPNDIATVMFSSGTTDMIKRITVTHNNLLLAFYDHKKLYGNVSDENVINIHSAAHIAPNIIELVFLSGGNTIIYSSYIKFLQTVQQYKSKYLLCVPKLLIMIINEYLKQIQKTKLLKQIYNICSTVSFLYFNKKCDKNDNLFKKIFLIILSKLHSLFYKVFYRKILNKFINPETTILVFGAAVSETVEDFFKIIEINLLILYGLTESITYLAYKSTKYTDTYTINPAIDLIICDTRTNSKMKPNQIGLIKIKGPQVMKEYYNNKELTIKVFDEENYLITGDLGYVTETKHLFFSGRQKNIIVLNNGENIDSFKIENICNKSKFINQIVVVGQDKPYLTALIVPNKEYLENFIIKNNMNIQNKHDFELLKKEILIDINNLIGENKYFKWIEQIKNITIIETPFTVENGLLTIKHTIARNKIYEKYKKIIEDMYLS